MRKLEPLNENSKDLVFPMPLFYFSKKEIKLKLWQLNRLGIENVSEIEMPFESGFIYYKGILPNHLIKEVDSEEPRFMHLKDLKERYRARIILNSYIQSTIIFTRYYPQLEFDVGSKGPIEVVIDTHKEDDEHEDGLFFIWKSEPSEVHDVSLEKARKWLNENYPNWEDPTAYLED